MQTSVRLLILGAGAFAADVADLVEEMPGIEIDGFVESKDPSKVGERVSGYPIRWLDDLPDDLSAYRGFSALGTTHRDAPIAELEMKGLDFLTLVHPSAQVSRSARLGKGVLVSRGSIIAAQTCVGSHVVINRGCLIGHHVRIGDFVTISPGANLAGGTQVGRGTYIGMGAILLNGVRVGEGSVVGAGSVVTRDVPDRVQVLGIPARVTKTGIKGL